MISTLVMLTKPFISHASNLPISKVKTTTASHCVNSYRCMCSTRSFRHLQVWMYQKRSPFLCAKPRSIISVNDSSLGICCGNYPVSPEMLLCAFHRVLQDRKHSCAAGQRKIKVTLESNSCFPQSRIKMWLSVTLQSGEREAILRQLILNTAGAGADQTQPKAFLSSKLSNHHFSTSGPQCMASPALLGLCVCISATLF